MLVLSRRVGQDVVIAGTIRLTVLAAQGDRVRIGVAAPRSRCIAGKSMTAGYKGRPISRILNQSGRLSDCITSLSLE